VYENQLSQAPQYTIRYLEIKTPIKITKHIHQKNKTKRLIFFRSVYYMSGINLDINNYTIKDIESLFKLPPNYTGADVELKEYELRTQLFNNPAIDKRYKTDIVNFLESAKNLINFLKFNQYREKQPTTITNNWKLDNTDFPVSKSIPSREGELTVRPTTQYIYSDPGEFFPGVINPLNNRITTKVLTIDTKFRDNYFTTTSSDFILQLPERINKVVSMQLSSIEIPLSFYGISQSYGNNFLYIDVSYNSGSNISNVFTVPDGNYSGNCLVAKINQLLQSATNPIFSNINFSIDLSYNSSGSGKVLINTTGTTGGTINSIGLDFTRNKYGIPDNVTPLSTKIGWALGFKNTLYTGSPNIVSDTIIEPFPLRYIYLSVNDFNTSINNNYISAFNKSSFNADVLGRISLNTPYFSLLSEDNYKVISEPRKYFGPVDLQRLQIRIYDDHGRILDMNNADYSFSIVLKTIYDL